MLPVQAKYVEFLKSLKSELQALHTLDIESFGIDNAIANITSTELLIPVIGGFSAGKSSLLNSFFARRDSKCGSNARDRPSYRAALQHAGVCRSHYAKW